MLLQENSNVDGIPLMGINGWQCDYSCSDLVYVAFIVEDNFVCC
jgi:hypothetical protein